MAEAGRHQEGDDREGAGGEVDREGGERASAGLLRMGLLTGLAGALLGALGGCDLDLAGATRPAAVPMWMVGGAAAGLVCGLLIGIWQARYEATTGVPTPSYTWISALGGACLALSIGSFIASQRVPGVRPLVVASAPIRLDGNNSAHLTFTSDTTAAYAILLALREDPAVKLARDLGLKGGTPKPADVLPARQTIVWTSDVPGSQSQFTEHVFETSGAKQVSLGSLKAVAGQRYTLTATVVKPLPAARKSDAHIEVHRTIAAWAKAFPRELAAGALGLLAGIAGIMLMVFGGLQRHNARQQQASVKGSP